MSELSAPARGYCGKGECHNDLFTAYAIIAWEAKEVVQVRGTDINIREDRVDRIRIVMVRHRVNPLQVLGEQDDLFGDGRCPSALKAELGAVETLG